MSYFNRLYQNDELPQRAKLVYIYLHDRMDSEKKAWPSINRIGTDLSMSRSTVKRAIADLVAAGYVRKETAHRKNQSCTSNRYHLLE